MSDADWKPDLIRLFEDLGFRKRAKLYFTVDLPNGMLGVVPVQTRRRSPVVQLNPYVGIHHGELERRVSDLTGWGFDSYRQLSVSQYMIYYLPDPPNLVEWLEVGGPRTRDSFVKLRRAVVDHIFPFFESVSTLSDLIGYLESGYDHSTDRMYRLPVAHMLNGDEAAAVAALDAIEEHLVGLQGVEVGYHRHFLAAFGEAYGVFSSQASCADGEDEC